MITEQRAPASTAISIGPYLLHREIARGGMASVHLARLIGDEGFSRIVAAKLLHPRFAKDDAFIEMFLAEAQITSKLRHPNIVPVLDVVTAAGQVVLVQEFVHGAPLHWLLEQARHDGRRVPIEIAVSIACQVLSGLQAAHVLTDEVGQPLDVVHRDVSPQNVMIATDGTARLLDFGVANTSVAGPRTRAAVYKGKVGYSAPEQLRGAALPQSDVYSLAVVLWELLVGHRMFEAKSESELVVCVLNGHRPRMREALWKKASSIPSETWAQLEALEPIVEQGLELSIADRWNTAEELELALRAAVTPAPASAVAHWLNVHGKHYLEQHQRAISDEESSWRARPTRRAVGSTPPEISGLRLLPPVAMRPPRASLRKIPTAEAAPIAPAIPAPPVKAVPEWAGHGAVVAVLGALIVAALVGIVLVMRASSQATDAPPLGSGSEPAQGVIFRPGVRPPPPVRETAARGTQSVRGTQAARETQSARDTQASRETQSARGTQDAPDSQNARDSQAPGATQAARETQAARPPVPRAITSPAPRTITSPAPTRIAPAPPRPAVRPVVRPPPAKVVARPRPAVAPAAAKPATDGPQCSPPYYFEGAKKHFKPACL